MRFQFKDDARLGRRLRARDRRVMAVLYRRYSKPVYSLLVHAVGDKNVAEWLVLETFLRMWNQAASFDPRSSELGPWIMAMARECAGQPVDAAEEAPPRRPPARLKRRVLSAFGVQPAGWAWLPTLAALCLLAVGAWLSIQERRRASELGEARQATLQVSAERDRLLQALTFLSQPDSRPVNFGRGKASPRGNVWVNSRLGVLLLASQLPALAPGRAYEMWVMPKGGSPHPAGLFRPAPEGSALHLLSGPIDIASLDSVSVSVEPEAGSQAPTTAPVIAATL